MALTHCPKCNHKVSDASSNCSKCGALLVKTKESGAHAAEFTTAQETNKRFKIHIMFSSIIFWLSFLWLMIDMNIIENGKHSSLVAALLTFSVVWYIVIRLRYWWQHK